MVATAELPHRLTHTLAASGTSHTAMASTLAQHARQELQPLAAELAASMLGSHWCLEPCEFAAMPKSPRSVFTALSAVSL